ncbi:hypothetical protein [Rhizobium gallicum]|uniref:hypothetical protein n=1 Tax=Rhizobium gallicum TaxID=56730 RepID=UPI0012EC3FEA|nr:hypothetical protein [Rhizobium gallicum]
MEVTFNWFVPQNYAGSSDGISAGCKRHPQPALTQDVLPVFSVSNWNRNGGSTERFWIRVVLRHAAMCRVAVYRLSAAPKLGSKAARVLRSRPAWGSSDQKSRSVATVRALTFCTIAYQKSEELDDAIAVT